MLRKKSVIILGGVDVAKEREINYGIWLNPWKSKLVRFAYRHADKILVVDPSLKEKAVRLAKYNGNNIVYLPMGYNSNFWRPSGPKEPIVLTAALYEDPQRVKVKGIDKLIETARVLKDVSFVVVGVKETLIPTLQKMSSKNITFIPPVPRERLVSYYQRAKVYCQPSYTEGFPNALCEAMLCGCIPVGTKVAGIPTAIGDSGLMVPYGDISALSSALKKALAMDEGSGQLARNRIANLFPMERREKGLIEIISGIRK
ncbi:glycosyltransferase family 4 protein [candidate division KSB1 bacterium]|nr:glycosyltransferase family 4 protein [candidate division KSB1 bacterium]